MKYDVVIAGAGPAGTTVGRQCALKGLKTLILEKEKLPRYKPCGGAVSDKALSLLDFKIKDELIERECYGLRIRYKNYRCEIKKSSRLSILTSRGEFDLYLAEKAIDAGAELRDGEKVKSAEVGNSEAILKTDKKEYKASALVGADGVNSCIAKRVRPRYNPSELMVAIEAPVAANDKEIDDYIQNAIEAHFGLVKVGYGWVFPKRGHFSVGIGELLSENKNPRVLLEHFAKKLGFKKKMHARTHLLPVGGYDRKTYSDRILLVGDAAGYVDPFTGEGIYYAISSSIKAAEVLVKAWEKEDFSSRELWKYKQNCETTFGTELKHALRFSRLVYGHQNMLKIFANRSSFLDKYLEIPAGNMSYKEFMKWMLVRVPFYASKML